MTADATPDRRDLGHPPVNLPASRRSRFARGGRSDIDETRRETEDQSEDESEDERPGHTTVRHTASVASECEGTVKSR